MSSRPFSAVLSGGSCFAATVGGAASELDGAGATGGSTAEAGRATTRPVGTMAGGPSAEATARLGWVGRTIHHEPAKAKSPAASSKGARRADRLARSELLEA